MVGGSVFPVPASRPCPFLVSLPGPGFHKCRREPVCMREESPYTLKAETFSKVAAGMGVSLVSSWPVGGPLVACELEGTLSVTGDSRAARLPSRPVVGCSATIGTRFLGSSAAACERGTVLARLAGSWEPGALARTVCPHCPQEPGSDFPPGTLVL